ncbi:MAG: DUF2442 domain-containing protein [Pacificimonas sp.]|jgi:hypothetical protein|nr:DUF2442 domain-containing protein [Pacificimonas sp.]
MAELTERELDAAKAAGIAAARYEPRARAAAYDAAANLIRIELKSGASFAFPPHLSERLNGASPADLAAVEVVGAGFGLYWPALDEDLSVPGLLAGDFGTRRWMKDLIARGVISAEAA